MPELFYPASTVIILDSPMVVCGSGLRRNDGIVIMFNRTEVEITYMRNLVFRLLDSFSKVPLRGIRGRCWI